MARLQNTLARNKLLLSLGLIITSVAYAFSQHNDEIASPLTITPSTSKETSPNQSLKVANEILQQTLTQIAISSPTTTSPAPQTTTMMPVPTPAMMGRLRMMGLYVDGSYPGSAADAYYGTVQVQAVVQGGKITDVVFLQYPNDRANSRLINSQAMPLLTQEALQAQNAKVDGVSGATFTSQAFKESLAAALVLAKS